MESNNSNEATYIIKEQGQLSVQKETNRKFDEFKKAYLGNMGHFTNCLNSIYSQNNLDIDSAYYTLNGMFGTLDSKIDAIIYLNAIYTQPYFVHEHSIRVALMANLFASWLKLSPKDTRDLTIAGLLHDIGMLEIPQNIIEKPGKLTIGEKVILKGHTKAGALMLIDKGLPEEIWEVAASHHERYDGSGYPKAKKGDSVGFYSKAVSIIDSFDAMTSYRNYQKAQCPFGVIKYFEREMMDKFDPELLYVFLENIPYIYRGSLVQLSDGEQAEVVFINMKFKTSPIVRLVQSGSMIDLSVQKNLNIVKLL